MGWTLGAFIGPIISGYIAEQVGYYEMSCVIGLFPTTLNFVTTLTELAIVCLLSGVNTVFNLDSKVHFDRVAEST